MSLGTALVPVVIIVLLANTVEAIAGFGSTILALTLCAQFLEIDKFLPILLPLNIVLSLYIVIKDFKAIQYRALLLNILPIAGLGFGAGIYLTPMLKGPRLQLVYGIFVFLLATFEIFRLVRGTSPTKKMSFPEIVAWLFTGGIVQGIYASGGPLIVYYSSRLFADKRAMRGTLSLLWLLLNAALCASFYFQHAYTIQSIKTCGILFPAVIAGIILGDIIHSKIPDRAFKFLVFGLLLVAGGSLIYKTL